jgi:hypothetical protein
VTHDRDKDSAFFKGLEQTQRIATNIALVFSGMVFAAGLAGLVYVVINVLSASPPGFGSQGEWLYGGVVCLLVAGWGFSQAAKSFARLRNTETKGSRAPRIQISSEGLSIELPPLQTQNTTVKRSSGGFTWSFSSSPMPIKTFKLDEAQIAAADAAAGSGADWDAACRQANPEYAAWSDFDQSLYRQAIQSVIEARRGKTPG